MIEKRSKKNIHIELTETEINRRIDQIEVLDCDRELRDFLISALEALVRLDEIIGMKNTTIMRLRKIFGKKSEKLENKNKAPGTGPSGRSPGQGNNGSKEYPNAPIVEHELEADKKAGNPCPECGKGTLYDYSPGIYIRIYGSPTFKATKNITKKTRCSACGAIFEASFKGQEQGKYDASAVSILAIMHYLSSMPFYRLEKLQKMFLNPMPRSVQWELMEKLANQLIFVWKALIKYAQEGDLFFADDTTGKILSNLRQKKKEGKKERTRIHTTGIISERDSQKVILFFTGIKYSGENLDNFLSGRTATGPVAIMSDALNQNNPKKILDIIHYLCLAHGRRKFEDLEKRFQEEVNYVQQEIALIYKNDKYCKENSFDGQQRLLYHQENSGPVMDRLHKWCTEAFDKKLVEPNSSLGSGIRYLLSHWDGLTGFLKYSNAPIDNNALESQLRTVVMNRKNWLWYASEVGALVGDIILSILKTCEISKIDTFRYLNHIQENADNVRINPEKYFPWNVQLP